MFQATAAPAAVSVGPLRSLTQAHTLVEKFIGIADPFPGGEEGIKAWIDDMRSDKDYE